MAVIFADKMTAVSTKRNIMFSPTLIKDLSIEFLSVKFFYLKICLSNSLNLFKKFVSDNCGLGVKIITSRNTFFNPVYYPETIVAVCKPGKLIPQTLERYPDKAAQISI